MLTYSSFEELSQHLRDNDTALVSLSITHISSNEVNILVPALCMNTVLTSLDICYSFIGTEGAKALACNTTLTSLDLDRNNIGDEGARGY